MTHATGARAPFSARVTAPLGAPLWQQPVAIVTAVAFALCFGVPVIGLIQAWLSIPDANHGLLIAPVAGWLAWRTGIVSTSGAPVQGGVILMLAIFALILGHTAGVDTVPRLSLLLALGGLTIWYGGWRQVMAWWLPFVLLGLTVPMPESIIAATTIPLQGIAAKMGAAMLEWRNMPIHLSGNVIQLPGHTLFVSEACSGLRSLTALVSLAVLAGALFLRHAASRLVLLGLAVLVAIVVNGLRVFLTGFLVYFVDPKLGDGFMHFSEGYFLFLMSLAIMGGLTWLLHQLEDRLVGTAEVIG